MDKFCLIEVYWYIILLHSISINVQGEYLTPCPMGRALCFAIAFGDAAFGGGLRLPNATWTLSTPVEKTIM